MKAHRTYFVLMVASIRKLRLVTGSKRVTYMVFDVKELVVEHTVPDFSNVTHNIISSDDPRLYSSTKHIMDLRYCDLYPHESTQTTYRLATIPQYAKREADYQGYRYAAYDVKDLVEKHKVADVVQLQGNIICAKDRSFYTQLRLILKISQCDTYPNDFGI